MLETLSNPIMHLSVTVQVTESHGTYTRWYLYWMVTQNSELMVRTHKRKWVFSEKKKTICDYAADLIKCLMQIKQQGLLLMCAHISELPSYISTMQRGLHSGCPCECSKIDKMGAC